MLLETKKCLCNGRFAFELGTSLFSFLNSLSKEGKWEEMTAAVSDDVVRLFAAVGRHEEIAAQIEQRFGGVAESATSRTGQL